MPVGPQLPSTAEKRKRSHEDDSDSSDDDFGPALPADSDNGSNVKKARVMGPSLPPTGEAQAEKQNAKEREEKDNETSDDDDFGPSLPPAPGSKGESADAARREAENRSTKPVTAPPKVQRDEWMTLAPTSGDWSQRVDPTKLKNRKFNTGKSNTPSSSGTDMWNETPEQKQARLRREVLGIKGDKTGQDATPTAASKDEETARRMKEYNSQRGPSLYEAHQKGKTIEEDDPSARAFDREKDIAGGLQINATKRREMMKKSSDFNSRFSSARYL